MKINSLNVHLNLGAKTIAAFKHDDRWLCWLFYNETVATSARAYL